MTEVAFHFNAPDKLAYACRLLRKAVGSGAKVVVLATDEDVAALDRQLWSFSALEFVPHCRADADPTQRAFSPVILATQIDEGLPHRDVLVNLGSSVPNGFDAFTRVIDVVSLDEADRQLARQRWKRYTELGFDLVRHDLNLREPAAG